VRGLFESAARNFTPQLQATLERRDIPVLKKSGAISLGRGPLCGRQTGKRAAVADEVRLVAETGSGGNGRPVSKSPGMEPKHCAEASKPAVAHRSQANLSYEPSFEGTLAQTEIPGENRDRREF
jgi:hypothetical protein